MAQPVAPTDDSSAGTRAARRLNQDYMKMYQFLSLGVWRHLGSSESQRSKAEVLCEFLYLNLEMRLPTEPTLGMMTALVVSSNPEVRSFDLHTALQLVRSTWKSTFKRLEKNNAERIDLLPTLPATFAELPPRIQSRLSDQVATQDAWLLTEGQLAVLQRRVKLRGHGQQAGESGAGAHELANALLALLPPISAGEYRKREQGGLKNLQIFSPPAKRSPALPAGSRASTAEAAASSRSLGTHRDRLALMDCPARAHASTSAGRDGDRHLVEQPARQLGASAMGAGALLCGTQGDEVVLRGPFMQAPVSGQSVAAHETSSRDGNVSTPMRKTVAVGKSAVSL